MTDAANNSHKPTAGPGRVATIRGAIAAGTYEVDSREVADAIVWRLIESRTAMRAEVDHAIRELRARARPRRQAADEAEPSSTPQLKVAAARPSTEDIARAQLNRYAVDLRRSYQRELERSRELEERSVAIVRALATAVAERDDETGNHIQRVHDLGLLLARKVIPDEADDPHLAYGFILHDIGKVAVPDAVLRKPGPLDPEEEQLMRIHPEAGARMLDPLPFLGGVRELVLHHHERWDGSGYPHGLSGEEIPPWARLFAIVDTLDAMTGDRPYRAALPLETAVAEIAKQSGHQFDPDFAAGFLALDLAEVRSLLAPQQARPPTALVA